MAVTDPARGIPLTVRFHYDAIVQLTDAFCRTHLNEEYAALCRVLAGKLARKQTYPLEKGRLDVWACGIVRTIGWVNSLDDPREPPHLKLTEIDKAFGIASSTAASKSRQIRTLLKISQFDTTLTCPSRVAASPRVQMHKVKRLLSAVLRATRTTRRVASQSASIHPVPADGPMTDAADRPAEEHLEQPLSVRQRTLFPD